MYAPSLTDPEFDELMHAITSARQGIIASTDIRIARTPTNRSEVCQALLFIKPEALARDVDIDSVVAMVLNHARETDLSVGGVSVLGWSMMASGLMADHYSVINRGSRLGGAALTTAASEAIAPLTRNGHIAVLGAHQAMDRFGLSSDDLLSLAEASGIRKVAQGTYVTVLDHPHQAIIINAFHPAQLEHFTAPGAAIVAYEVTFDYPWIEFRDKVLGPTDPNEAPEGSLRRKFLDAASALNLRAVSRSRNCIHGSGGPVEAMAEIARFFRIALGRTQFGAEMSAAGLNETTLSWAASNPTLEDGSSLFEATECVSPKEAHTLLKRISSKEHQQA